MAGKRNYDLKNFYIEWEKYAQKNLSPNIESKKKFEFYNDPVFKKLMASSPVVTFIINHAESRYVYFSENSLSILGYSAKEFMEGGVAFGMSITSEDNTHEVADFLFPKVFEHIDFYKKTNELDQIQLAYNYKIKRKDGSVIWSLHLMSILDVDPEGNPLLSLVHLIDISHIKKDSLTDFCIKKRDENGIFQIVHMERYSRDLKLENELTGRELEILVLISQGEPSKIIADKLNISINTVHNHRKKMLEKTGCKSSAELINYGRCMGIALPGI